MGVLSGRSPRKDLCKGDLEDAFLRAESLHKDGQQQSGANSSAEDPDRVVAEVGYLPGAEFNLPRLPLAEVVCELSGPNVRSLPPAFPMGSVSEISDFLDTLGDAFSDPLATVDRVLGEHGVGTGHDLRDVLDKLPPELLTERLLCRCLSGLSERWPELRFIVLDALRTARHDLAPDPANTLLSLLSAIDAPPSSVAKTDADSLQLFWREVGALRLLSPAEQRCLGDWIGEGQLVENLAGSFERTHGQQPTGPEMVSLLVEQVRASWDILRVLLPLGAGSSATWRTLLVALAYGITTDEQLVQATLPPDLGDAGARVLLSRAESAIRVIPDTTLAQLADVLAATGGLPDSLPDQPDDGGSYFSEVVERGRDARRVMVRHNLRLVLSIARGYAPTARSMELMDLVQEGTFGLLRAVERWQPGRGYAFSTYGTWWIRQAMSRAIADQDLIIRLPVHVHETMRPLLDEMRLSLEVSDEERDLATDQGDAFLALTTSMLSGDEYVEFSHQEEVSQDFLKRVIAVCSVVSLEADVLDRAKRIVDEDDGIDPESAAVSHDLRRVLHEVLGTLDLRVRLVLELRYGLRDGWESTLEEVGRHLGVTRERVRQIEAKGLRLLQDCTRSRRLRGFVPDELIVAASEAASEKTKKTKK